MKIIFDTRAAKEFEDLSLEVRGLFDNMFEAIENGVALPVHVEKKLKGTKLLEYRIKYNTNIYRALAANLGNGRVILLIFQKKTQKTPQRFIETASKRLKSLL